jgi:hypothetical protein
MKHLINFKKYESVIDDFGPNPDMFKNFDYGYNEPESTKENTYRYTAFVYRDKDYDPQLEKEGSVTTTVFEEFTVKAKSQKEADKKASIKVKELYPRFKDYINFWKWGEREQGRMQQFR